MYGYFGLEFYMLLLLLLTVLTSVNTNFIIISQQNSVTWVKKQTIIFGPNPASQKHTIPLWGSRNSCIFRAAVNILFIFPLLHMHNLKILLENPRNWYLYLYWCQIYWQTCLSVFVNIRVSMRSFLWCINNFIIFNF